jgi:hypothetical protein
MPSFNNDPLVVTTADTSAVILAQSDNHTDQAGPGVMGKSDAVGVWGESNTWNGVVGISHSTTGGFGVWGKGEAGPGVAGISDVWVGVYGETNGATNGPAGIWGDGKNGGFGVKGHTSAPGAAGVGGFHLTNQGPGVLGVGNPAGRFEGDVEVSGEVRVQRDVKANGSVFVMGDVQLVGGDLAEDFQVVGDMEAEAGSVVVLAGVDQVRLSDQPYDRRVAGVVSGAGANRPGLILDSHDGEARQPLALAGTVWCKVDADWGPVELGDPLTTSPTPGHAMLATDPARAFGSVIGKALADLPAGRALVPVLVTLR